MKNKIATTIEQSKKLIELGIDLNTADMTWEKVAKSLTEDSYWKLIIGLDISIKNNLFSYRNGYVFPAWSLSALLSLLPISVSKEKGYPYYLEWQFWNDNSLRYVNPYSDKRECLVDIYSDHDEKLKDYIDTAFEMICYLKENKLI